MDTGHRFPKFSAQGSHFRLVLIMEENDETGAVQAAYGASGAHDAADFIGRCFQKAVGRLFPIGMKDSPILGNGQEEHGIVAPEVSISLLAADEGFDDPPAVHDTGHLIRHRHRLAAGILFQLFRILKPAQGANDFPVPVNGGLAIDHIFHCALHDEVRRLVSHHAAGKDMFFHFLRAMAVHEPPQLLGRLPLHRGQRGKAGILQEGPVGALVAAFPVLPEIGPSGAVNDGIP